MAHFPPPLHGHINQDTPTPRPRHPPLIPAPEERLSFESSRRRRRLPLPNTAADRLESAPLSSSNSLSCDHSCLFVCKGDVIFCPCALIYNYALQRPQPQSTKQPTTPLKNLYKPEQLSHTHKNKSHNPTHTERKKRPDFIHKYHHHALDIHTDMHR